MEKKKEKLLIVTGTWSLEYAKEYLKSKGINPDDYDIEITNKDGLVRVARNYDGGPKPVVAILDEGHNLDKKLFQEELNKMMVEAKELAYSNKFMDREQKKKAQPWKKPWKR